MASTVLSPTRALRQPRRLDARVIVGICLLLVATGGSIAFWSTSSDTRAVLVATRDLPAGATLVSTDLTTTRVRVDDAIYAAALPAAELSRLVGKPLAAPVFAHQILVAAQIAPKPPLAADQVALTIAASPENAVGGRIRPGDSVEVLLTTDKGKPDAQTSVVMPHATVYDAGYDNPLTAITPNASADPTSGSFPRGSIRWLTLVVTRNQAQALARAKWQGELDLALLPPDGVR